tara:strand:+ start:1438 stop:2043 length:606 start_codon:yes stop_codon:yes gene_type:complete
MKQSPFYLPRQNQSVDSRIVVALERISEAFRVLLWKESKENALSPIQIQLLIFLLFHDKDKCKVSYLASEFNMTKATISDSVKVLLSKKLMTKVPDPNDTRSFSLSLTTEGKQIAGKAASFSSSIEKPIGQLSADQKQVMLNGLLKLIHDLNQSGVITIQRMCFSCANYRSEKGTHYCNLLKAHLAESELRVDCPEYQMPG